MNRIFKLLGIATLSALAVSAAIASPAPAFTTFTSEKAATISVSGNETQVYSYTEGGAQVKCTGVVFDESAIGGTSATQISARPTYNGCTGPLGITTHWTFNGGCTLVFTANGKFDICPTGGSITTVVTGLCTYHFGSQTVGTVTYDNVGSGSTKEVTVTPKVTGIAGTNTNPGGICGPGSSTTATLTGDITLTGSSSGVHVPLSAS